jgi:hypothetical protein
MTVRELVAELQRLDPEAEVRFFHLRRVRDDGSGRVDSYPVLEVAEGGDGEVTLSDFMVEDEGCALYKVTRREWPEQPALKGYPLELEQEGGEDEPEPLPEEQHGEPVDTLLVDPPFTRAEWSGIAVRDIGAEGTPLGRRVFHYLHQYHEAVMRSNRLPQLMAAAGMPADSGQPMTESHLRKALRRLVEQEGCTVHRLEVMIAAGDFVRFLQEQKAVPFGRATLDWLGKLETLTVLTLVVCVNKHFGLSE